MSKRLENETREEYKERLRKEQAEIDEKINGVYVVKTGQLNRRILRDMIDEIPFDDFTILSKMSEIAGEELPLLALVLLYSEKKGDEKKKLINDCIEQINEANAETSEPITETKEENYGRTNASE
jgi:hypothetical protein